MLFRSPVSGAPGAVLLYALLAVLLWPTGRAGPFEAARPFGARPARLLWLALWGSLAFFAVQGASGVRAMMSGMASGEPGWLASVDRHAATLVAGHGGAVTAGLAIVLGGIALGIFLPARGARAIVLLAAVVALVIWVVGENFGGMSIGSATDPNSGPLLVLLAAAYWPAARSAAGVRPA